MSLSDNINSVLQLQDVELANAMNDLKGDGAKLTSFIGARKSELYNTVSTEHSDSFQKVFGDLQRATDTTKNTLYYNVRNKDLNNLQKVILDRASAEAENASHDSQVAKRQFEINEWTSGNKMDTLFFFQILFIYLTVFAPLLYMKNVGFIPSSVFYGTISLLTFAVIMTVVVRSQYTEKTRDYRFWNRRRFAQMGGPPVLPSCPAISGMASDLYNKGSNLGKKAFDTTTLLGNSISNAYTAGVSTFNRKT
jgi:hypothetical protein